MCGIIAYIGNKAALPVLMEGLKRLEYRGYDSAGVALIDGKLRIEKCVGRIAQLEEHIAKMALPGSVGIAHTRWATHGEPTTTNAHPHVDCTGNIAVIHNCIIENFEALKRNLVNRGHRFHSDTDTEVLAHLIEEFYDGRLDDAVRAALGRVEGTFGIAVLHADEPRSIVGARNGSPLIVGVGDGEFFLASDASAILRHTRQVIALSEAGIRYTSEGSMWRECCGDDAQTWISSFAQTSDSVTGNPITPDGIAHRTPCNLPLAEWELVLAPNADVLIFHIPAGAPLTFDMCGDSFHSALKI